MRLDEAHRDPALSNELRPGNLELIDTGSPTVFAFRRRQDADHMRVIVDLAAAPARVTLAGDQNLILPGWGWLSDGGRDDTRCYINRKPLK